MWSCCTQGTLIVPLWRSAPFWPLLTTDGSHLAHFVEDWVDLPPLKATFCMGCHSSGVFGRENLNFRVLAVRINFRSARFFITGFYTSAKVGVLNVHLLSLVSGLFFGGTFKFSSDSFFSELMASDGLRSVGGLQVASGWLMQTPLGIFVLASGWLARSQ